MLCVVFAPVMGLADETTAPGPRAVVSETVYEFQPLVEGSQVDHLFIIGNQGDLPLEILDVKSG
jgi:hypothetical protein